MIKEELEKYLDTDTLVYWDEPGTQLRLKQEDSWSQALSSFSKCLGLPSIVHTDGFFAIEQPTEVIQSFQSFLDSLDHHQLASK